MNNEPFRIRLRVSVRARANVRVTTHPPLVAWNNQSYTVPSLGMGHSCLRPWYMVAAMDRVRVMWAVAWV